MMTIYRNDAEAMVAAYWRRLDPDSLSADATLDGYDESSAAAYARRFFHTAAGVLIAAATFIAVSLLCSARVMGLKYTLKRVGAGANFAGVIFGMFLLVLCAVVARTTYFVPDAVTVDVEVTFKHDEGSPSHSATAFEEMLKLYPERIFQDDAPPSPPPGLLTQPHEHHTNGSAERSHSHRRLLDHRHYHRRLLEEDQPPPSPQWAGEFPSNAVWVMMVERRELDPPVATVIALTVSFSGVNVSADVDMNATLPPAVEARVTRAAMAGGPTTLDVKVMRLRPGAHHPIGGAWAAHLLAAAGAVTVLSSAAGFIGVTGGSRTALALHLAFCVATVVLLITSVQLLTDHAEDTQKYINEHWRDIQTGVVGEGIAAQDAAAFANQHMRSAAALGAVCTTILTVSMVSSIAALAVYGGGWFKLFGGWGGGGSRARG
jgi:hypothetical protein